jgi:CBS domain-containing protein
MGEMKVASTVDSEELRRFMKALINDVRAMEVMLNEGLIETGVRRIGAEQELFLVDRNYRPAPIVMEVLRRLNDPHFTTELGAFNIEFNCDSTVFETDCLSRLEKELEHYWRKCVAVTQELGGDTVMAGILPTLTKEDLTLENMAPVPRYRLINEVFSRMREGEYEFRITGTDDLLLRQDSVMTEACCTSFQLHFQVGPKEFAELYNVAQAVTAPVLAVATNSPLLFGKRLWRETRIALFQQSVDTRPADNYFRDVQPRVGFGTSWVKDSVLEIFREDITRHRTLISTTLDEDPFEALRAGRAPKLQALRLHNGTVYRWNRACYGITDGKPHLRIECRVIPAGPTVVDEVANAAFWFGLMSAVSRKYEDVTKHMAFEDAKGNFIATARLGLDAQIRWLDGKLWPSQKLILDQLLPMAEEGLRLKGIAEADIRRYLPIIGRRVETGQTGGQWLLNAHKDLRGKTTRAELMTALASGIARRQKENRPVHEWDLPKPEEAGSWKHNYRYVSQYMSTDIVSVGENELVDLVACLMDWHRIRHVLVEDAQHRLVGIVSHRSLLRLVARGLTQEDAHTMCVSRIMTRNPVTVGPRCTTLDAIRTMRQHRVSALPIVDGDRLIGIVTERDFMPVARQLLEEMLSEED